MSPLSKETLPPFWRRLHALTGTVPLGIFVVLHLWSNSKALAGERAYENASVARTGSALFAAVELLGLWMPLVFHAGYGLSLVVRERADLFRRPPRRGRWWLLDRLCSVVALVFVVRHAAEFRIPVLLGEMIGADFFPTLCSQLSSTTSFGIPLVSSWYLIGLGSTAYHLGYGLIGFPRACGLDLGLRAARWARLASIAVGVVTFLLGATTVLYFATGSGIPGISQNDARSRAPAF